jgi:mono/diheme cytochrome c family protein
LREDIVMRDSGSKHRLTRISIGALGLSLIAVCRAGEPPQSTGAELYGEFCASCHGIKGHGDGPVAASFGKAVPDLTGLARRHGGTFPAEEVHGYVDGRSVPRAHGTVQMPVWGREFFGFEPDDATHRRRVAELIDRLVDYLRAIQE